MKRGLGWLIIFEIGAKLIFDEYLFTNCRVDYTIIAFLNADERMRHASTHESRTMHQLLHYIVFHHCVVFLRSPYWCASMRMHHASPMYHATCTIFNLNAIHPCARVGYSAPLRLDHFGQLLRREI